MSNNKTINDYSITAAEGARQELRRRFRDENGAKVKGHRNGETDKRFTKRGAFVKLGTKALVELAQVAETQVEEPKANTDTGSIMLDGSEYALVWENDIPTLVAI